jgi:dipeptidyl aminopeptidase/acylaminoacyl peptidase
MLLGACSSTPPPSATPTGRPVATGTPAASPIVSAAPTPTPAPLPPYAIEALRSRVRVPGTISVGAALPAGPGYTKHTITWPSANAQMTGVLAAPTGPGPFPVVIVNHGYVPVGQYYTGQDSSKYADPLAAAGFLTLSPNYPGYSGSGPGTPGVPAIVAEAISDMDLISALPSLSQADPTRVAVAGHSNGGGVSLILLAADSRVRAAVLYAPVSSDMADNARKWWVNSPGSTGGLPGPDQAPEAYRLMSPRAHLPPATPPTLVMQGTNDEDIPAEWTSATVSAMQSAGVHVQFVSFPGAMHNFQGGDLTRANSLAVSWLQTSLSG